MVLDKSAPVSIVPVKSTADKNQTIRIVKLKYVKETSTKDEVKTPIAIQTEGTQKLDAETNSTQPKRRHSKRKPTSRRGQTRGRGRRPYSPRKKLEGDGSKKTTKENSTPSDLIEKGEKQFNKLPDNVEVPIIPLPAPYVRPKAKSDSPGSVPDGNVNEG